MKKLLVVLLAMLLLAACGEEGSNRGTSSTNPQGSGQSQVNDKAGFSDEELVLSTKASQGDFELRLVTDKLNYSVDEPVSVYAELVYQGEQEKINIGHSMYPIGFSISEHTRDIGIDGAMAEPYIVTPMMKEQPLRYDYSFSGGYSEQDDPEYVKFFKQVMDDQLPKGRYTITAYASFVIDGAEPSEAYAFNTSIHFVVE